MKKINKSVLKAIEYVTRVESEKIADWPPFCIGIWHQPKRPDSKKN